MQSLQDAPALTLEDIMHSPSPSPVPQPQPKMPDIAHGAIPEVVTPATPKQSFYVQTNGSPVTPDHSPEGLAGAHAMQSRLQELGLLDAGGTGSMSMTAREKDLVDMVCRHLYCPWLSCI